MQLEKILIGFLVLLFTHCQITIIPNLKSELWESTFEYLDAKYFVNPLQNKVICRAAIVHLVHSEKKDYISKELKKIETFFDAPIQDKVKFRTISEKEFKQVNFPLSFQNFDNIDKEEFYFTKNNKCGLLINAPLIIRLV